jgi:hypothetical protein
MNTIHSPSVLNSSAAATWIPVCLPKFNPSGFVNAYVNFLGTDDPVFSAPVTPANEDAPSDPLAEHITPEPPPITGLALICVSAGGDFEAIRAWGDSAAQVSFNLIYLCSVAHTVQSVSGLTASSPVSRLTSAPARLSTLSEHSQSLAYGTSCIRVGHTYSSPVHGGRIRMRT